MNPSRSSQPFIGIACGGTGGHLFPGLAVAECLRARGCDVGLFISPKEVDQQAVASQQGFEVYTLPAVGLQNRNYFSFIKSFCNSFVAARRVYASRRPAAVLAMGGFTSAPPVLAARKFGAKTFLHDSNTIPGKANRFLARYVDEAFVGFPAAAARLRVKIATHTGTPVRPQFRMSHQEWDQKRIQARVQLGLDPDKPVILVVGGSQGARGLNDLVLSALPLLAGAGWQFLHLTGQTDFPRVKAAYASLKLRAIVKPFLMEMDLALAAAEACISRSGASALAELAAVELPAALVPLPTSADNHQYHNAKAYDASGAARLLPQDSAPVVVCEVLSALVRDEVVRHQMQSALVKWQAADAAEVIAARILRSLPPGTGGLPTASATTTQTV